ncbi:hypothetical protein HDV00_008373 [Rhizophlyctis rosea]|nr:hypothetical protein HDV00_008373 [Rhizophlyctis rosea]
MDMNAALEYAENRGVLIRQLETDVSNLKCENQRLESRKEEQLAGEIEVLKGDRNTLEEDLHAVKQGILDELEAVKADRDRLRELLKVADDEKAIRDASIAELKAERESLEEELRNAQRSQHAAKKKVGFLKKYLADDTEASSGRCEHNPSANSHYTDNDEIEIDAQANGPSVMDGLLASVTSESESEDGFSDDSNDADYEEPLNVSESEDDTPEDPKEAIASIAQKISKIKIVALLVMMKHHETSPGMKCRDIQEAGKKLFNIDLEMRSTFTARSQLREVSILTRPSKGNHQPHPDYEGEKLFSYHGYGKLKKLYWLRMSCEEEFDFDSGTSVPLKKESSAPPLETYAEFEDTATVSAYERSPSDMTGALSVKIAEHTNVVASGSASSSMPNTNKRTLDNEAEEEPQPKRSRQT